MSTKVIVTNFGALTAKYGSGGMSKLNSAIAKLVKADKAKEIDSIVVGLDRATDMGKFGGSAVSKPNAERETKLAIDAICKKLNPAYLLILGAADVVCHIKLTNPVGGDGDPDVPSDLPYACDTGFSREISAFLGPTRVAGRLPDIAGGTDPLPLVKLLERAAKHKPRPKSAYVKFFGITADVWTGSTTESLGNIFGDGSIPLRSPPARHPGINSKLKARSWFINCHGAPANPAFFGEGANRNMPEAIESAKIAGRVASDTVIAAECCYGAELYDVAVARTDMPICNQAMLSGAIAFTGSTNIAYGPANGNGAADLITQFFLIRVLGGASSGRAFLQSQHQFIQRESMSDPVNLKTIGQFLLLGDPSLQPCETEQKVMATLDQGKAVQKRRVLLASQGKALQLAATFPVRIKSAARLARSKPLAALAKKFGYRLDAAAFFRVSGGATVKTQMKARNFSEEVVTLAKSIGAKDEARKTVNVLVARISGKSVISYREYVSR